MWAVALLIVRHTQPQSISQGTCRVLLAFSGFEGLWAGLRYIIDGGGRRTANIVSNAWSRLPTQVLRCAHLRYRSAVSVDPNAQEALFFRGSQALWRPESLYVKASASE